MRIFSHDKLNNLVIYILGNGIDNEVGYYFRKEGLRHLHELEKET